MLKRKNKNISLGYQIMGIKNREYCVVIYTMDLESVTVWCENNCLAFIVGEEVGKEKERYHIQGLVQFKNPRSWEQVKKELGNCNMGTIHKNSTIRLAYEYCTKGQDKDERLGKWKNKDDDYLLFKKIMDREPLLWESETEFLWKEDQGKRTDLELIHTMVDDGSNMREIISQAANYQGIRTAEKLLEYFEKPRDFKPEVYWFWGKSETGKSRTARELAGDDVYEANVNGKWWNGYDRHESVVIDDFRYDWKKFEDMLKMCDRYGYRVETKGGMRQLVAKKIFITCPYTPREAYKYNCEEDLIQLERRLTEIREFRSVSESGTEVSGTEVGEVILNSPTSSATAEEF